MVNFCKEACDICGFEGSLADLIKMKGDVELLETPYGKAQTHPGGEHSEKVAEVIQETTIYMETQVFQEEKYAGIRGICKNFERNCAYWTAIGECEASPTYMLTWCAPTCQ